MLTESKFSKYLLYAIGEIALVVIGILIALQINNFNSHKKERQLEQEYLMSLKSEFETNLDRVNASIEENEERSRSLENLMTLFDKNILDTVSEQSMARMFAPILGSQLRYEPTIGVLNSIISSGNINILENKSLRKNLASFESSMEHFKIQEEVAVTTKDLLLNFFYKKGSGRKIAVNAGYHIVNSSISDKVDNKQVFNSVEFENHLLDYLLTTRSASGPRFLGGIKTEIVTILEEIEQEQDQY